MNRIFAIIMAAVYLVGFNTNREGTWVIDAQSRLTIEGSTNISTFTCKIDYCPGTDTLHYTENSVTHELRFNGNVMSIPIRNFDCGAKAISRDFCKTLEADRYPVLRINFITLQNLRSKENITGMIDITLAGATARYHIGYRARVNPNGNIVLTGTHKVKFLDFGLEAPEKLKGLIKVNEGLTVTFHRVLKEV